MDQADALLHVALMRQRTLQVVEHGQHLADQPLVGARGQLLLVARHPLAVVVELRLQALQRVEVLVALPRDRRKLILLDGLLGLYTLLLRVRLAHLSSTTSYSASSTTSSSEGCSEPPSVDELCCCADAFAYSA